MLISELLNATWQHYSILRCIEEHMDNEWISCAMKYDLDIEQPKVISSNSICTRLYPPTILMLPVAPSLHYLLVMKGLPPPPPTSNFGVVAVAAISRRPVGRFAPK